MLDNQDALVKKAKDCFNNGEYKNALVIFNELLGHTDSLTKENLVETYFNVANIFHMKGQLGKAIKAFKKVLAIAPEHTDASISLSVLYNDIGKYEEAKKIFEKANERVKSGEGHEGIADNHINKKFSLKHYELAELYFTYGRLDEALFEYNKSITLDPDLIEARVKIAKVYAKKNFVSKALDELRKLKNENPDYLDGRVALGVLYFGSGKVLEAQNEWQKVLSKSPSHQEAKMYLNLSETATETRI